MTRVEELRESVLRSIGGYKVVHAQAIPDGYVTKLINALIAAAEARGFEKGKAEGAEQERRKILESAKFILEDECTDGFAECDEYVFPASVFACDKEEK